MFNGYYSREYYGWSVVGYNDERGNWKPIQKFFNPEIDKDNRRSLIDNGCRESQEADPAAKARDLVGMLNGGRDFHRLANATEMHNELLKEAIQQIKNLTDAVHRVANVTEGIY